MGRVLLLAFLAIASRSAADSSPPDPGPGFGKQRDGASRTQLADGRILIAGGDVHYRGLRQDLPVRTVELFDPRTHRSTPVEPMHIPRSGHLATLLRDGRVLVTGGAENEYRLLTTEDTNVNDRFAEEWDPRSGQWNEIEAPINVNGHTATLLPDGKVLIVGGRLVSWCSETSQMSLLFDPATDQMKESGRLAEERSYHTAVPLPDGSVLVYGGTHFPADRICWPQLPVLSNEKVELWDPRTGTWSRVNETPHRWK
jgi:hypothetical protein